MADFKITIKSEFLSESQIETLESEICTIELFPTTQRVEMSFYFRKESENMFGILRELSRGFTLKVELGDSLSQTPHLGSYLVTGVDASRISLDRTENAGALLMEISGDAVAFPD
jgi:hypothetical protein